jgi:hypothetical protein
LIETAKEEEFDSLPNRLKRITFLATSPQCNGMHEKVSSINYHTSIYLLNFESVGGGGKR